jgi:deoxyadenosine/deoxycytidine kinase
LKDLWNNDPFASAKGAGRYVAITGNTGSGKSSLVRELTRMLQEGGKPAIGINERALHHPLLDLMFHIPKKYALGIQLNFLVQRHLILTRWLELGYIVVIERSHLDDRLFMETHLGEENVTQGEFSAYSSLFDVLSARLPDPDVLVFLDASPELSLMRLRASELAGERPEEFPDDHTKGRFVTEWSIRFKRHYQGLLDAKAAGKRCQETVFLYWKAETPTSEIAASVASTLML